MERFAFFGMLMGFALLQTEAMLDIELATLFWKRICDIELDETDLASIDESVMHRLNYIRHFVTEEEFDSLYLSYEANLSDESVVELVPEGSATDVKFSDRSRYCDLWLAARFAEGKRALEAVKCGMSRLVPSHRLLSLMSERELQRLVCGEADFDVAELRKHTTYGVSASPNDRHVMQLWQVLEAFSPEQRRLFLTFVWGRNRLPLTEREWGETRMKIHTLESRRADDQFPKSRTCFFSFEWPRYSSFEIAHGKLLYAISNCRSIDNDNTGEGRANRARWAVAPD